MAEDIIARLFSKFLGIRKAKRPHAMVVPAGVVPEGWVHSTKSHPTVPDTTSA